MDDKNRWQERFSELRAVSTNDDDDDDSTRGHFNGVRTMSVDMGKAKNSFRPH